MTIRPQAADTQRQPCAPSDTALPAAGAGDSEALHRAQWLAYWNWCLFDYYRVTDESRAPEVMRSIQHTTALGLRSKFADLRACIQLAGAAMDTAQKLATATDDEMTRAVFRAREHLELCLTLFDIAAETGGQLSAFQEAELSYLRFRVWGTPVGDGPMTYREPDDEPPAGVERGQRYSRQCVPTRPFAAPTHEP